MREKIIYILLIIINLIGFSSLAQNKVVPKKELFKTQKDTTALPQKMIQLIQMGDSLVEIRGNFISYKKNVHASYYADKFHGKRTASGKIYNMNAMTAAHKKLPFGTKLKVTNETNNKFVIVEITDRGPFVKGREIDLSKKAFQTIVSNKGSGAVNVTLEILKN
jgi:rare lipoprotein A